MCERGAWLIGSFVLSLLIFCGIAWAIRWALQPMMAEERTIDVIVADWSSR